MATPAQHRSDCDACLAACQRRDWLADDALSCELVSAPNSLLTGKITGNFAKSGPPARFSCLMSARIQELTVEFPTQRNREFSNAYQGIFFEEQGILNRGSGETGRTSNTGRRCSKLVQMSAFGKDEVIGLPACGWRKIRVLRFRLMVKRGPHLRPQASEGEAQHGLFCWTRRVGQGDERLHCG